MADRKPSSDEPPSKEEERWHLLNEIDDLLDKPMAILAFIWLGLIIWELSTGLNQPLSIASSVIWILFILDFVLQLIIAPRKLVYIKHNWLVALSILLPALRIFGLFRAFRLIRVIRTARSISLLRLVLSFKRSMQALGMTLRRRGFGYVVILTIIVILAGAAGIIHFENPSALARAGYENTTGITSYGDGLWWTAMIITTMGSDYWPQSAEGRILCWILAIYAFTVFGYITATIASHFVRMDKQLD